MDTVPGKALCAVCAIYYNNAIGFVENEIWQWVRMCQAPLGLLIFDTYDIVYILTE